MFYKIKKKKIRKWGSVRLDGFEEREKIEKVNRRRKRKERKGGV